MALTILYIFIIYIIGGFLIGKPMGKKSLEIWKKEKEKSIGNGNDGGFWGFVLFPASYPDNKVGTEKSEAFIANNYHEEKKYLAVNFLVWPIRISWNTFWIIMLFLVYGIGIPIYKIIEYIFLLLKKIFKLIEKMM